MYNIKHYNHPQYNEVLQIEMLEDGRFLNPFQVVRRLEIDRRLLIEAGHKIRILVNNQILTLKQAEQWADVEYKSLPKCEECGIILHGNIYNHNLSVGVFFCSEKCSTCNYNEKLEKMLDEREIDYL